MRTRSNTKFNSLIQSAKRASRRFSPRAWINNRPQTIDVELQVVEEIDEIRKECRRSEVLRKLRESRIRDILRRRSLSSSNTSYYDNVPYEAMGTVVALLFVVYVILCFYFAEPEDQAYEASGQN